MALQPLFIRGWKQLSAYLRPSGAVLPRQRLGYKEFTKMRPAKGSYKS